MLLKGAIISLSTPLTVLILFRMTLTNSGYSVKETLLQRKTRTCLNKKECFPFACLPSTRSKEAQPVVWYQSSNTQKGISVAKATNENILIGMKVYQVVMPHLVDPLNGFLDHFLLIVRISRSCRHFFQRHAKREWMIWIRDLQKRSNTSHYNHCVYGL